jgi:hypothetical protein
MRRDQLAAGEKSAIYTASEKPVSEQQWDLAFLSAKQYCKKYQITCEQYELLTS